MVELAPGELLEAVEHQKPPEGFARRVVALAVARRQSLGIAKSLVEALEPPAPPEDFASRVVSLALRRIASKAKSGSPAGVQTSRDHPLDSVRLIAGRYLLLHRIGKGAMESLWAALDTQTQRRVAVKLFLGPRADLCQRLLQDARARLPLRHPNIIDVYDVVTTERGDAAIVMQLLSGDTLEVLLARKRRLDPSEAAAIARSVAHGLDAVHSIGVVHRDLNPANIFLHYEGNAETPIVKVLDLRLREDLSDSGGDHTFVGDSVGSLSYMSPEQLGADRDIDAKSDLWSLGVVLFEMLTGVRPFQGEAHEVTQKILCGRIPTVPQLLWKIDADLARVVDCCLCRERRQRIGSAQEIAWMLDPFAGATARSTSQIDDPASRDELRPLPTVVPAAAAPTSAHDDMQQMDRRYRRSSRSRISSWRSVSSRWPGAIGFIIGLIVVVVTAAALFKSRIS